MQKAAPRPLPTERQLRRQYALSNMETKFGSILGTKAMATREELWLDCVAKAGADKPVTLLEFGVFKGRSMTFWCQHFTHPQSRFYGFDSFEGLPEDWAGKMRKGFFSTGGATPITNDSRVTFYKGWIQNTLPEFIRLLRIPPDHQVIVHVDIDLYSAALFILTTLWHHVGDYFVVFDEFGIDENVALGHFSAAYPVAIDFYSHTFNVETRLPRQVFGRLARKPYAPSA
jgi:hypothetical protein